MHFSAHYTALLAILFARHAASASAGLPPRHVAKRTLPPEMKELTQISITNMNVLKEEKSFYTYPGSGFGSWASKDGTVDLGEDFKPDTNGRIVRRNQHFPELKTFEGKWKGKAGKAELKQTDHLEFVGYLKIVKAAFIPHNDPIPTSDELLLKQQVIVESDEIKAQVVCKDVDQHDRFGAFENGDLVWHEKFNVGRIESIESDDDKIKVNFEGIGKDGNKIGKKDVKKTDLFFVFQADFTQKYIVDKRILDTFEADNRIKYLKQQIGMVNTDSIPDAIGLQEVSGKENTKFEEKITNVLKKTHMHFEFRNSPKRKMYGGMFLSKTKFKLIEPEKHGLQNKVQIGDGILLKSGKTGKFLKPGVGVTAMVQVLDEDETKDEITTADKIETNLLITVRPKRFTVKKCAVGERPSANCDYDFQKVEEDGKTRTLVRTVGVVAAVKVIGTEDIVIFGTFHFKSGKKNLRDIGQRYYDCIAFLDAVNDVKAALKRRSNISNKAEFPVFLFGDANADGNTVTFKVQHDEENNPVYHNIQCKKEDLVFDLVKKYKLADILLQLGIQAVTSWKLRRESASTQVDKTQVEHKIYGDPCWYDKNLATAIEVTMPWLESQLILDNKRHDNDNFCMIRPEHPSDHCSISQTFVIHSSRKPKTDEEMRESMLYHDDGTGLGNLWRDHTTQILAHLEKEKHKKHMIRMSELEKNNVARAN